MKSKEKLDRKRGYQESSGIIEKSIELKRQDWFKTVLSDKTEEGEIEADSARKNHRERKFRLLF